MNMRMDPLHVKTPSSQGQESRLLRVVLATQSSAHAFWLASALGDAAQVVPAPLDAVQLQPLLVAPGLGAVVVDFSAPTTEAAAMVVAEVRRQWPGVALLGAGSPADPASMLTALRSGVVEFVDWQASAAEASSTLKRQLLARPALAAVNESDDSHFILPLLGARVGMGVTTLATHLAVMLQQMQAHDAQQASHPKAQRKFGLPQPSQSHEHHAALLDLGLPARDGLLYLGVSGSFSFADAVHNLRRLDATLLDSVLDQHASGATTLAWPADLSKLREVSPASATSVMQTLKPLFKAQVVDLGGLGQVDFVVPVLQEASQAWVVCDQSMGGIVSTAQMLKELESKGVDRSMLKLVINRFNAQAGLPAKELALRLGLELVHVVPDRATALLNAASCGQLLSETMRGDLFVTSIRNMSRGLLGSPLKDEVASSGVLSQWAKRLRRGT
ncbi:MAG: histidine kinase [Comamonas sp.]